MKKKILSMVILFLLVGCAGSNTEQTLDTDNDENKIEDIVEADSFQRTIVNIGTLKGPTGLGMLDLMEKDEKNITINDYEFQILSNPTDMIGKVVSGEVDIAALPTNMASILYNKMEGGVTLLGVNTLGVLYILENGDTISTLEDFDGKTLYATGQGAVPEYVINALIEKEGLDINVEFKAEHSELSTLMANGDITVGMLPEPNVTATILKNDNIRIAIDISKEWEKQKGTPLAMGGIVVRDEFLQNNKEAVEDFIAEYEQSVNYTNNEVGEASQLAEKFQILPSATIAEVAIPFCNIVWRQDFNLTEFFRVLKESNPASIGGEIPDENFYYVK